MQQIVKAVLLYSSKDEHLKKLQMLEIKKQIVLSLFLFLHMPADLKLVNIFYFIIEAKVPCYLFKALVRLGILCIVLI